MKVEPGVELQKKVEKTVRVKPEPYWEGEERATRESMAPVEGAPGVEEEV